VGEGVCCGDALSGVIETCGEEEGMMMERGIVAHGKGHILYKNLLAFKRAIEVLRIAERDATDVAQPS
jgi:hypothetical protein